MLCFAELVLPPELRAYLMQLVGLIDAKEFKPMNEPMMHCTAVFYGKIDHRRKEHIRQQLVGENDEMAGTIRVIKLDLFPESKRNLVVAVLEVPREFHRAQQRVTKDTGGDLKPWVAHVTLGKLRYAGQYVPPTIAPREFQATFNLNLRP